MLRPCQFRNVTDNGQLVCAKITQGNREVTPEICQACPVAAINCTHLRFSLEKQESGAIVVHYANGRTEIWDGEPSHVRLQRAACSLLAIPVSGPSMCAACALRHPATPEAETIPARPAVAEAAPGKVVAVAARQDACATC